MEWRLMFPTLPAMLVALWLCEERLARRLGWIALFLAGMVATAAVVAWAWRGHEGAVGPIDLLWTGKAVRSVWAGFTWAKVGYLWDGMVAYLLGAGVAAIPGIPGWDIWRYIATVWMLAVAAVALPLLWRARRRSARARPGGDLRRHLRGRRGLQPLLPAAGPADADQRHGLADGRLGAGAGGGAAPALRRPRTGGAGRPDGGAVRLQCLEPRAAARAGQRLGAAPSSAWSARPIPTRTVWLMHDFDWAMVYGSLHWGSAEPGSRHARPCAAERPQVQVDRLHRPGAAPSRLERRAAGRRPARARSIARWSWATTCWSSGCGTWTRTSSRSRPAWWRAARASQALRRLLHERLCRHPGLHRSGRRRRRPAEEAAGPLGSPARRSVVVRHAGRPAGRRCPSTILPA